MSEVNEEFLSHAKTGLTTLCRCWLIRRMDGKSYGFTDHDMPLSFDDQTFKADTGLTALALQQGNGMSIDNTEAIGVLSDASVSEDDVYAGRFDGAEVTAWLVNWADVSVRWLQFRGSIGELRRGNGAFHAELRGLTEALNKPLGRIYQKPCTAVLGDKACGFDLGQSGYTSELEVEQVSDAGVLRWTDFRRYEPGWFARGRFTVLSGDAAGLWSTIKRDSFEDKDRVIELWEELRKSVQPGDMVRIEPGCDKRLDTCRLKFNNIFNFQGFPDIPGEDWVLAVPKQSGVNSGGSRR